MVDLRNLQKHKEMIQNQNFWMDLSKGVLDIGAHVLTLPNKRYLTLDQLKMQKNTQNEQ